MRNEILSEALAVISQGVLIAGSDRRILFANDAFTQITGYTSAELIGRSCDLLQGPESSPEVIIEMRSALNAERSFAGEILNYTKAGVPFWNDLSITPFPSTEGICEYFVGVTRDITAQKTAEQALKSLEVRDRFIFDHVQSGVILHDATTRVIFANATALDLLETPVESVVGTVDASSIWEFYREDGTVMPIEEYPVNQALSTGRPVANIVLGWRRTEASEFLWTICSATPVLDELQNISTVVVSFADVTEMKRTEQALLRAEERMRLIVLGTQDAAWDLDLKTNEVFFSQRWWEMIGTSEEEVADLATYWWPRVHPEDLDRVRMAERSAIVEQHPSFEVEFRFRHREGKYIPLLSRAFILRNTDGVAIRLSGTLTDLSERKRDEAKIYQLAFYDPLTELPNRQLLMELLGRTLDLSRRMGQSGALLYIDLDNFKTLNDSRGHDVGDLLLKQVARRLRRAVRSSDTVARLGGDEFVVVVEGITDDGEAAARHAGEVAAKIQELLGRPYHLGSVEHRCTSSIGIAPFGAEVVDRDDLLRRADLAMYEAKAAGRDTYRYYDAVTEEAVNHRLLMENDLRKGLKNEQLRMFLQPIVDSHGTLVGAEALVRWLHPIKGMLPPSEFIPIAEDTGLIVPLGNWMLASACHVLERWEHIPTLEHVTLGVNVSARQFRDPAFVGNVTRVITESRARPTRLKFEITETLLAENLDDIVAKMTALRTLGIAFSLDDFGTGYSSLSYLRRMPLNEIKIDRSFVEDIVSPSSDSEIARLCIALGCGMGLAVVAEGVETELQRQFLIQHGCRHFQGFLFGRPQPIEDFESRFAHSIEHPRVLLDPLSLH